MFYLVYYLMIVALVAVVLYWVIRLGVRHGMQDVERQRRPEADPRLRDDRGPLGPSADRLA